MNEQEQKLSITLGDLSSLLQIIDVVSQRGAIQGSEMQGVGLLRNKLEMFLKQSGVGQSDQSSLAEKDAEVETQVAPKGPLTGKVVD